MIEPLESTYLAFPDQRWTVDWAMAVDRFVVVEHTMRGTPRSVRSAGRNR